jgi:hypothetical protein
MVMKLGVFCVAALAAGISSASAKPAEPMLQLSRTSGPASTRVLVVGRNCRKPFAQADTLAWHDHYYWLRDIEKRPPMGVWRSIPVTRTSPTTVRAVFVVRRSDHPGRGLLDLFCGGSGGNATATFDVTR